MRPYSNGTRAQRDAWEELVLGIETLLPLGRHAEGSLASLTSYLYDRTGGSIGSLRALLSDAAIAILDGAEKVDRKLLDTIPTDHAAEEFRTRTPVKHRCLANTAAQGRMRLSRCRAHGVYGGEGVDFVQSPSRGTQPQPIRRDRNRCARARHPSGQDAKGIPAA